VQHRFCYLKKFISHEEGSARETVTAQLMLCCETFLRNLPLHFLLCHPHLDNPITCENEEVAYLGLSSPVTAARASVAKNRLLLAYTQPEIQAQGCLLPPATCFIIALHTGAGAEIPHEIDVVSTTESGVGKLCWACLTSEVAIGPSGRCAQLASELCDWIINQPT
jgi:hypothetical protein